ncbi:YciI family protein [Kribbella sp. NPDC005582]|uniref:YciI family protein n=1 Tax=Kribbella sp. NPDC005582 TaxID=3156893 RepID=UPI0033B6230E
MKYVVMIFRGNDQPWLEPPPALAAVQAELTASGELVGSEGLQPPAGGRIVQIRNGQQAVTDAPLRKSDAQLAGFLLIDAADDERAHAIAAQVSAAVGDRVELRGTLLSS